MNTKRLIAAALSLCMLGGTLPYKEARDNTYAQSGSSSNLIESTCYTFNTKSGLLTLHGYCYKEELEDLKADCWNSVKSVYADNTTLLPEDCSYLFSSLSNCTAIDLSKAKSKHTMIQNGSEVNINPMNTSYMFSECTSLQSIIFPSDFQEGFISDASHMFENCKSLTTLTNFAQSPYNDDYLCNLYAVKNTSYMFYNCSSLEYLPSFAFNLNKNISVNAERMFCGCTSLESLTFMNSYEYYLSNMSYMFANCNALKEINNLSAINTSNVTDMASLFSHCKKLTDIDLSHFRTYHVKNMSAMFYMCGVKELDLSGFNTANVTNMAYMFGSCDLKELDLSGFDTTNVTSFHSMFQYCSYLKKLRLDNFDLTNAISDIDNISGFYKIEDIFDSTFLESITFGKNFYVVPEMHLQNAYGWFCGTDYTTNVAGTDNYASIKSSSITTYYNIYLIPKLHSKSLKNVYFRDNAKPKIDIEAYGKISRINWYIKPNDAEDFSLYGTYDLSPYNYNRTLEVTDKDGNGLSYEFYDGAEMYFELCNDDISVKATSEIITLHKAMAYIDRNVTAYIPTAGETLWHYMKVSPFIKTKQLILDKDAFYVTLKRSFSNEYRRMKENEVFRPDVEYRFYIQAHLPETVSLDVMPIFSSKGFIINGVENPPNAMYDLDGTVTNIWEPKIEKPDPGEYTVLKGDINGDGTINLSDLAALRAWLSDGMTTYLVYWENADINEDGVVDVFDLIALEQMKEIWQ